MTLQRPAEVPQLRDEDVYGREEIFLGDFRGSLVTLDLVSSLQCKKKQKKTGANVRARLAFYFLQEKKNYRLNRFFFFSARPFLSSELYSAVRRSDI